MAGDPASALLLMAMGVDSLSMNLGSLLKIKWMIRSIRCKATRDVLAEVMRMDNAAAIREHANTFLDQQGLSGPVAGGGSREGNPCCSILGPTRSDQQRLG